MRTTLTLDDDVAVMLERVGKRSNLGFKHLVNQALRLGLQRLESKPSSEPRTYTRPVDAGRCRIALISVSDALALAEGDSFR